jgi:hypothetical protein
MRRHALTKLKTRATPIPRGRHHQTKPIPGRRTLWFPVSFTGRDMCAAWCVRNYGTASLTPPPAKAGHSASRGSGAAQGRRPEISSSRVSAPIRAVRAHRIRCPRESSVR